MLLDPKRATINDVQPLPDKFGYEITFWIEGVTAKERFSLNNPWRAWIFAQMLDMCEREARPEKLVGRDVWLIIGEGVFDGDLIAVSKKENGYFYPLWPFSRLAMQGYTVWQMQRDWNIE